MPLRATALRKVGCSWIRAISLGTSARGAASLRHWSSRCVRAASAQREQAAPYPVTVLILDGNNIGHAAAADRNRWHHLGATLPGCFAAYLHFLRAATGSPSECYVAFDKPKSANVPLRRKLTSPNYLRRRHLRNAARWSARHATLSWSAWLLQSLRRLLWGSGSEQKLAAVSRSCGFVVVEAQGGWEADDAIAAICRLVSERDGPRKSVAIVTNDMDMQQLLDRQTMVLRMPPWHESSPGSFPLRQVTAEGFESEHGYPPAAYAFRLAVTGKRASDVPGCGLPPGTVKRLVRAVSDSHAGPAAVGEGGRWPDSVRTVLKPDAGAKLDLIQRNMLLTKLHDGQESLPDGFELATARGATQIVTEGRPFSGGVARRVRRVTARARLPAAVLETTTSRAEQATSLEALIWMHPFHASRARYLKPHVNALCALLSRVGVRHHAWAVTVEGLTIDIALLGDATALHPFGFRPSSVLTIAGEGDVTGTLDRTVLGHSSLTNDFAVLEAIRRQFVPVSVMSGALKVKLRNLKKVGWRVHVVHHCVLERLLQYYPETNPLE